MKVFDTLVTQPAPRQHERSADLGPRSAVAIVIDKRDDTRIAALLSAGRSALVELVPITVFNFPENL